MQGQKLSLLLMKWKGCEKVVVRSNVLSHHFLEGAEEVMKPWVTQ